MLFANLANSRHRRMIQYLRATFPGDWCWNSFSRAWEHESGMEVRRCAALAPQHDMDDDTYIVQTWLYHPAGSGKPPEQIVGR